jgi:hypothetical protein
MINRGSLAMVTGDHALKGRSLVVIQHFKPGEVVAAYINGVEAKLRVLADSYSVCELSGCIPISPREPNKMVSPFLVPTKNLIFIADRNVVTGE